MRLTLTLTYDDGSVVNGEQVAWTVGAGADAQTGNNQTTGTGLLEFTCNDVAPALVPLKLKTANSLEHSSKVGKEDTQPGAEQLVIRSITLKRPGARPAVVPVQPVAPVVTTYYDIADNNTNFRDWLIWETEGNSDPKYQRGGRARKLGLYSLNYDLLRKAGAGDWAARHTDGTIGGGWVKVAVLDELDYASHAPLIGTFLPSFTIPGGKLAEPKERAVRYKAAVAGRNAGGNSGLNSIDVRPPLIVMPFNYDDNSSASKAIGRDLHKDPLGNAAATRLTHELTRWATASRSTITAFDPAKPSLLPNPQTTWNLRPGTADVHDLPQVIGDTAASKFLDFQLLNNGKRYYSVKTGVNFVATQNQGVNGKDLLESNSIHAMSRSNLIAGITKKVGEGRFEAKYQIEILSILLGGGESWDGIQIREIGEAGRGQVWFPALAIPMHGKAFAEAWQPGCVWTDFWGQHFARPLGRAKAEMLAYFGLQHMTSNAQNFLVAFDRGAPGSAAKHVILRDIGDTILNTRCFDILKPVSPSLFGTTWDHEVADAQNGIVLAQSRTELTIGGGYANPQITRIGVGIVFFFPPFLKGDLNTDADPGKASIVARWCLQHNEGFLEYMREKLGYDESWSAGSDVIDGVLLESIKKNADLSISGKSEAYANLASDVMGLSATTRQRLINELRDEISRFAPTAKQHVNDLQRLVAGHELLICAEIHAFLGSDAGGRALVNLHKYGTARGPVQPPPVAVKARGPAALTCANCGKEKQKSDLGWFKCGTCAALFCGNCTAGLAYPPNVKPIAQRATTVRACGVAQCGGTAAATY